VELAASGTLSVVGPDGWPLGVGARFVTDAAGAPALCLAAAGVAAPDAPSSFHVEVRGRCSAPDKDWVFRGSIRYNSRAKVVSSSGKIQFSFPSSDLAFCVELSCMFTRTLGALRAPYNDLKTEATILAR
jgi:hypothetical protein